MNHLKSQLISFFVILGVCTSSWGSIVEEEINASDVLKIPEIAQKIALEAGDLHIVFSMMQTSKFLFSSLNQECFLKTLYRNHAGMFAAPNAWQNTCIPYFLLKDHYLAVSLHAENAPEMIQEMVDTYNITSWAIPFNAISTKGVGCFNEGDNRDKIEDLIQRKCYFGYTCKESALQVGACGYPTLSIEDLSLFRSNTIPASHRISATEQQEFFLGAQERILTFENTDEAFSFIEAGYINAKDLEELSCFFRLKLRGHQSGTYGYQQAEEEEIRNFVEEGVEKRIPGALYIKSIALRYGIMGFEENPDESSQFILDNRIPYKLTMPYVFPSYGSLMGLPPFSGEGNEY